MQNPLLFGIIGALVAVAMLVTELLGNHMFTLQFTSECGIPLWTLFATYSALQFIVWRGKNRAIDLSDKEVATWGRTLEEVTPEILRMYAEENRHVRDIAASLEASRGIPKHITLRYIIALGRHLREHGHEPTANRQVASHPQSPPSRPGQDPS